MAYNFKIINYMVCDETVHMDLDLLYSGDGKTLQNLDYNLSAIINTEAPITLNVLKGRLRDAFGVKKISQKALDIIDAHLMMSGFPKTDNLFDIVYWPEDGIFDPKVVRMGYERQIYDVPYQEMVIVARDYIQKGFSGEALYRELLKFYGYEVLTSKAVEYLEFVEHKSMAR